MVAAYQHAVHRGYEHRNQHDERKQASTRHRQSLDELANVQYSVFDATGRLSPPISLEEAITGVSSLTVPTQPIQPAELPERSRARTKRLQPSKLYERATNDPGSIMHSSSAGELGTLRTRLRRPKKLDPYRDPIARTPSIVDSRAVSPSRNLGLRGKSRSQPRPATLSPKRYGSHRSTVGANRGSGERQLEPAAHGGSAASERPRVVSRGNMTVCITRPSTQSLLRRSASDPFGATRLGRTTTPPTGSIRTWKQMLKSATWADQRPSSLDWKAEPEAGERGLPDLRRALKRASGFASKQYVLARA